LRFGDFLKATVLLSAASATLLAALTVVGLQSSLSDTAVYVCFGWWILATLIGSFMGSRTEATAPIANLLAGAKHQHTLPELAPARTIANRLWPLLIVTLVAGVLSVFAPQVGGIAAGFAIIWALAWRRRDRGARRRPVLRRPHLAAARDQADPHPGFRRRLPALARVGE
jgi:hypothetical protein